MLRRRSHSLILLREFVVTDFKLRYQSSVLGYVWSLLRPMALFIILYFIFVKFLRIGSDIQNMPIYLLLGIVLWNFFSEVTNGGVGAIVGRGDLIRKVNFPKYVIVLSGSISALINLIFNLIIVTIFLAISQPSISLDILLLPLLFIELFVLAVSVAFLLSALFVRLRDVNYIWEVFMQAFFYATPILYPLSLVPLSVAQILLLNPLAQIIQDIRYILVTPQAQTIGAAYQNEWMRLIPILIVILIALIAWRYFVSHQDSFAEDI